MLIDTTIGYLQTQTDTGYHHSYNKYKKSLDSLEKVALEVDYPNALGRIYFMIGSMNRWLDNYDSALVWLEKSYKQIKGSYTIEEVYTLLEVGDVYMRLGRKKLANDYYYEAVRISERLHTNDATAQTFLRLASVYYAQNSYRQALKMYEKTLSLARKTKYIGDHNTIEMRMLNNIGVCYTKLNSLDTALIYYDSSLREAHRLNEVPLSVAKGVVFGNMGRIYQLKGDYNKAILFLRRNVTVNGAPNGDKPDVITSLTYLGEIYLEKDSNEKFTDVTDKALKFSYTLKSNAVKNWQARIYGLKASFHAKQQQANLAYFYRTKQYYLKDSLDRNNEKENLQDIVLYRELQKSNSQIETLRKESETQEARIFIYLTMVILAIALLIIAAISINNYRKSLKSQKKLNQQISEQNLEIILGKNQLEQAIEELTALNNEKNKLLGMVAHDLRGPIYNITGVVQLLESSAQYSQLDESDAHLIDLIKKSCDNALEVINDLLEAAKMENGNTEVKLKSENINDIVKNTVKLYQSSASQKGITLNYSPTAEEIITTVNKEKINRAIGNLLSNAIKFSKQNGVVNVLLAKTKKNVLISVSDYGIGIPQADRDIIFDKFTKARRKGTAGEKSTGLGMSIVKQIVEAHNGKIWLESEVGSGTTFYIELPLK